VPGSWSVYDLRHRIAVPDYHPVHIQMLRDLETMTGDPSFGDTADLYVQDGQAAGGGS
jgi:hypothetical protein